MGNKQNVEKKNGKMVESICSKFNEFCERFSLKIQLGGKTMSCLCPTKTELKEMLDFIDDPKKAPDYLDEDGQKTFCKKVKNAKNPTVEITGYTFNQYADGNNIYSSGYTILRFDYCGMQCTIDAAKKRDKLLA